MSLVRTAAWVLVTLLLVPALTLTVGRAGALTGGHGVRLVAFTPYAVPLYAASLLLLLPLLVRRAGSRSVLARLAVLGCVAALVVHAWWLSPALLALPAAATERGADPGAGGHPAAQAQLRVMTANLQRGEGSTDRVARLAERHRVDLLVVQEVDRPALARLRGGRAGGLLPHVAGRATAEPRGTVVLSARPLDRVRSLPTRAGSHVLTVRGGPRLLAVHTAPPVGDVARWWSDLRLVVAEAASARAEQQAARPPGHPVAGPGDPQRRPSRGDDRRRRGVLVVGDLNATTDHQPLRELAGRGFRDAATQSGRVWQPTWPGADGPARLGLRVPSALAIDHVLTDEVHTAVTTRTFGVPGSDHRALLAVLRR